MPAKRLTGFLLVRVTDFAKSRTIREALFGFESEFFLDVRDS